MENFKVVREFENKLLNFMEVEAISSFAKTPSKQEVAKIFCEKYKAGEECCVVKRIEGNFGTSAFTIIVRIYPNEEMKDRVEVKRKAKKKAEAAAGGAAG